MICSYIQNISYYTYFYQKLVSEAQLPETQIMQNRLKHLIFCLLNSNQIDGLVFQYICYSIFTKMQSMPSKRNRSYKYEKDQIESSGCLDTISRSFSTHSSQFTPASNKQNKCNKSRQKGISLIHAQSLQKIVRFTPKFNNKQNQQRPIFSHHQKTEKIINRINNSSLNRCGITQKCISYKNIKVQQRHTQQKELFFQRLQAMKNEDGESTNKGTQKTLTDSNQLDAQFNIIQINQNEISSKNSISIDLESLLQLDMQQKSIKDFFSQKQRKNAIQRLYEQRIGKQLVTVQSLESLLLSNKDSLNYSSVESLQFCLQTQ